MQNAGGAVPPVAFGTMVMKCGGSAHVLQTVLMAYAGQPKLNARARARACEEEEEEEEEEEDTCLRRPLIAEIVRWLVFFCFR